MRTHDGNNYPYYVQHQYSNNVFTILINNNIKVIICQYKNSDINNKILYLIIISGIGLNKLLVHAHNNNSCNCIWFGYQWKFILLEL